ncbi:MAG: hypothetical protein H7X93_07890 [Sphingomonadaceae bacterium]|nr:hypothetical protein [Sphingomonadaceae bacterium]
MELIERVARVLAGQHYSRNAGNPQAGASAADVVDARWTDFLDDALAVLKTIREPTEAMAFEGDAQAWHRMVEAAIAEAEG